MYIVSQVLEVQLQWVYWKSKGFENVVNIREGYQDFSRIIKII
ncbi:Uncharacterised protein [Staphylococcus aureus]|nr:Uncharacterised protein [Staphylococcus aureus]